MEWRDYVISALLILFIVLSLFYVYTEQQEEQQCFETCEYAGLYSNFCADFCDDFDVDWDDFLWLNDTGE